ncbi:MAG: hypothetical protein ACOCU0_03880, partial [Bacillota bacterium]
TPSRCRFQMGLPSCSTWLMTLARAPRLHRLSGRDWDHEEECEEDHKYSPEWYLNFYETFDQERLPGSETYNRNDEYMYDRSFGTSY